MNTPFGRREATPPTKQGPHGRGLVGRKEAILRANPRMISESSGL